MKTTSASLNTLMSVVALRFLDNLTLGKYVRLYLKLLIDSTTSSSIESKVMSSTPFLAKTFPTAVPIAPLPTKTIFFIKKILCKIKIFLPN